MPPEIRSFLEGMLQDANITTADEETKEEMIKELFSRFDNYMTSSIVENLKEEDLDEFIKMGDEKKPKEEIEKFITDKIPNASEVFSQAMMTFRDMYLGNVVVHRNQPENENQQQETKPDTAEEQDADNTVSPPASPQIN